MPLKTFNHFAASRLRVRLIFLNRSDSFKLEDGGSCFVGFLQVEGEVEGPVVEVIGVDESLLNC